MAQDDDDVLPDNCGACGYHVVSTSECRRSAPHPTHDIEHVLAFWNLTRETDRCGAGTTTKTWVRCDDCIHWNQPGGVPLNPKFRQGLPKEWWESSGLCSLSPPAATTDIGRWTYWKATHGAAGCGDGTSHNAALEAAAGKQRPPV